MTTFKDSLNGPRGLMDKALASGAGDCGFESHRGRMSWILPTKTRAKFKLAQPESQFVGIEANFWSAINSRQLFWSWIIHTEALLASPRCTRQLPMSCFLPTKTRAKFKLAQLGSQFVGIEANFWSAINSRQLFWSWIIHTEALLASPRCTRQLPMHLYSCWHQQVCIDSKITHLSRKPAMRWKEACFDLNWWVKRNSKMKLRFVRQNMLPSTGSQHSSEEPLNSSSLQLGTPSKEMKQGNLFSAGS
jgi:hypothetical protein